MRLDKFLASCQAGSRQEAKQMIRKNRVTVNGMPETSPQRQVQEKADVICLDGKALQYEKYYYLMLNKPAGYVCSLEERGQRSVMELICEPFAGKLFPVGRLDKDTEGLLLLTNDGSFDHALRSPRKHVIKQYRAKLEKEIKDGDEEKFAAGLDIGEEKKTLPAKLLAKPGDKEACLEITEGRFHQVKRMFEAVGNQVVYLERLRIGSLTLDPQLKRGEYRRLTEDEVSGLRAKTGYMPL